MPSPSPTVGERQGRPADGDPAGGRLLSALQEGAHTVTGYCVPRRRAGVRAQGAGWGRGAGRGCPAL